MPDYYNRTFLKKDDDEIHIDYFAPNHCPEIEKGKSVFSLSKPNTEIFNKMPFPENVYYTTSIKINKKWYSAISPHSRLRNYIYNNN